LPRLLWSTGQLALVVTAASAVTGTVLAFLVVRTDLPGRKVLQGSRWWIPIAHRIEPALKRLKDQLVTIG